MNDNKFDMNSSDGIYDNRVMTEKTKRPLFAYFIPWKGDSIGRIIQKVLLIVTLAWLIVVGIKINDELNKPKPDPIPIQYAYDVKGFETDEAVIPSVTPATKPTVLPEYKEWYDRNNDMVGWIKIDGTAIDYPVMQVKGFNGKVNYKEVYDKNMVYLEHDFDGYYSFAGCITADYRAVFSENGRPANATIYGHNLLNGTYFHDVRYYHIRDYGREFYDEHPVIEFDTIYEKGTYKIFAIMEQNTMASEGKVFYYTTVYDFNNQKEFIDFYSGVLDRSMIYNPDIDLMYGDEIIALSTCYFPFGKTKDIRMVVFARRTRDGESPEVDVSHTIVNGDPLYYDYWYDVMGGKWGGRKWDPDLLKGYTVLNKKKD